MIKFMCCTNCTRCHTNSMWHSQIKITLSIYFTPSVTVALRKTRLNYFLNTHLINFIGIKGIKKNLITFLRFIK